MPSRLETFRKVLPVFVPQVDRIFVFLDGFDAVPDFLTRIPKVTVIRSQEAGDYHVSGRFLFLQHLAEPSVVVSFDDDIRYPRDYVARLVAALDEAGGPAVVGVHGLNFKPPYTNFVSDRVSFHFCKKLEQTIRVDELGAGTIAFRSDVLDFDMRLWKDFTSDDTLIALEAQLRKLPLWCVARRKGWLKPYQESQADSLWLRTKRDPTHKTALMRELIAERVAAYEAGLK
ncbi:hypothetical protein [Aestuariivirga litoralis]|uniref:hypothetical protein n=1 Tax=Aestuariivirga litoralis TaxID=2650924 RepID=UPI0018C6F39F|nr:hypothetical protein [Aestuariivirga litoralis]MBG1231093.1 glycosyltransferase [Aestuariivirga litoralis]